DRRRESPAHVRSVLYDANGRRGHRTGAQHLLRHHSRSRRPDFGRKPRRSRDDVYGAAARARAAANGTASGARRAPRHHGTRLSRRSAQGLGTRGRRRRDTAGDARPSAERPRRRGADRRNAIAGRTAPARRRLRPAAANRTDHGSSGGRPRPSPIRAVSAQDGALQCHQGARMNGQKPVVVVVDDEQGILDVVSRFAQRAGYEAITCSNGRYAIAQLQTRKADLVPVDLRMPEVGGLDVLRAIRDIDPRCHAVLMTGYASVETAVEAIKLGAMDYMSKPLDFARLELLFAGVRDDLEQRRSLMSIESD